MSYKFSTGSVRQGDIYFEDDRTGEMTYIDFDQDTITLRPSGSSVLYAQHNRVGIGTTTPDYTLDVAGDIGIDQKIYHNGDANTYINFTDDRIRFEAGGLNLFGMHKKDSAPHQVTVNNGNNNVDFVVNTNDANTSPLLRCDASAGQVGIGTASPTEILTLNATEATILFQEAGTDMATIGVNSSDNILIENKTINKHIVFKVNDQNTVREGLRLNGAVPEVVVNEQHGINGDDSLVDFRVESETSTHMFFVDGSADKVGIDTNSPKTALDVHHDPTSLANDTGGGEVVTFGTGNLTAGKIYYLNSSGAWTETDADAIATSDGLLGIALGSSSSDGVLLRGFFDATTYLSNFISGLPVYLSTTAASMDTTLPSGTGDIVRCIGYCTNTANVIYFCPESTTLELS